jgi:hypothetical protein
MKYWEIIADKLSGAGWSWAIVAPSRRTPGGGLVHAHGNGKPQIVHSDELLSAFLELQQTLLLLRNQ